ncbi:MAG TPA: hypothetical protein PLY93_09440, partial [Turneriella sp.]|nr:hypothetical protein [Turneriella sp.]
MDSLAAAFALFRRGEFAESLAAALILCEREAQNFWARYLAAISAAFEPNLKAFEKHLNELDAFETQNVYFHYLKAYYALLQNDVEKALWHYLQIVDDPEGWLARSLVKKFRKIKTIENVAFRAGDYIVLPPELPPPIEFRKKETDSDEEKISTLSVRPTIIYEPVRENISREKNIAPLIKFIFLKKILEKNKRKFFIATIALTGLALSALAIYAGIRFSLSRPQEIRVVDFQIADSAAVMPVVDPKNTLYTYKTREAIIGDFEKAKQQLKEKKVNQARYLLNRLLYSNADFQTREKARTFLGFIPEPAFTEFRDNIPLAKLLKAPKLRADSLLVFSGVVNDAYNDPNGKGSIYKLVVSESDQEYLVHAFSAEKIIAGNTRRQSVQIYGRFKGLVGE